MAKSPLMTSQTSMRAGDHLGGGIACQLLAVFCFAIMAGLIKGLGGNYSTAQVIFFRSLPALIPLLCFLPSQGGWQAIRTRRPDLQALRAVAGILSMYCGFHAIAHMALANYVAISFTAPLFGTLLSIPLLAERVGIWRLGACFVGFCGILIMVGPTGVDVNIYALLAVASAFFYGLVMIVMRRLGSFDNSAATVFYFTVFSALVGGVLMMADWVTPEPFDLMLLVAIGLSGGVGQIFMTMAFRLAPPSVVAPFDYTAMIWALAIGWFAFNTLPTAQSLIGAVVICASGLFILYRETIRGVGRPAVKRTSI